jgi:hypothetical protein
MQHTGYGGFSVKVSPQRVDSRDMGGLCYLFPYDLFKTLAIQQSEYVPQRLK